MLNHITLYVSNLEKSKKFFADALAPLGYKLYFDTEKSVGFGQQDIEGNRDFWLKSRDTMEEVKEDRQSLSCLAFTATSKEQVRQFYEAAIAAGGVDNGTPGYCPEYHPGYYAAFVFDPVDRYNIEAVFDDLEKMREGGFIE